MTIILPSATLHKPEVVEAAIRRNNPAVLPTHLWVETQADEKFNWSDVESLLTAGFKVTAQVREAEDVPPVALLENLDFGVVWMVPERFRDLLSSASHIKWALSPGNGYECELNHRHFDGADYVKDTIWPV